MTSRWPATSASLASIDDIGDVSITSATKFDRLEYDGTVWKNIAPIQQWVTVGIANAQYTSIQDAIDSITDATPSKPYGVLIHPGVYSGDIVGKDDVHLVGISRISSIVTGTIDLSGTNASIERLGVQRTVGSDGEVCVSIGDGSVFNANFVIFVTADYALTALKVDNSTTNSITGIDGVGIAIIDTGTSTKDIVGIEFAGAGSNLMFGCGVEIQCSTASSGNHVGVLVSGGTSFGGSSNRIYFTHTNAGYSGDACFRKLTTSLDPFTQAGSFFVARGNGGGNCTAFCIDTSGGSGVANEDGASFNINGYASESLDDTAVGDIQVIRLVSQNKNLPSIGAGVTLSTPRDADKSGFLAWVGTPSPYFTLSSVDGFTQDAAAIGYIQDTPRTVAGAQSVTLATQATSWIYADADGVLQHTTTDPGYNVLRLWTAWCDGVNAPVPVRENHPYAFPSAVADWAHDGFGAFIESDGADPTILSAAARTIKIVGANELDDHGITEIIPDSGGAAVTWLQVYTDGSGFAAQYGNDTSLEAVYNNAGTPTTGSWVVWQLYVGKTNLNTSTPLYVAVMHTADFANDSAAQAAIDDRAIANAPAELAKLELVRLGYVIIRQSTNEILSITIDKKVGVSGSTGGAAAASANTVSTNTTAFTGWLSSTDVTTQAALNSLSALGLKGTVQTTDATVTTLASATIPTGTADSLIVAVSAFQAATGDSKAWALEYRVKNVGGTVTVERFSDRASEDAGAAAWAAIVDASGATVRVRVTGEAAHTIRWNCTIRRANYGGV